MTALPISDSAGGRTPAGGPAGGTVGVGVGVLVLRDGQVLLGRRRGAHGAGTWSPPGGKLEFAESFVDCAQRELHEETGLVAGPPATLTIGPTVNDVFAEAGLHYVTVLVVAQGVEGEPLNREPDKCEGWAWFPWSALPSPRFAPLQSVLDSGWQPGDSTPARGVDRMGAAAALACRPAGPADASALAALAAQVFVDTYAPDGVGADVADEVATRLSAGAHAQRLATAGVEVHVATHRGKLVGLLELDAASACPLPLPSPSGLEVVRLYVQPALQRRGVGRALLQVADRRAAALGRDALWLTAWSGNARALAFYRAQGFADLGATHYRLGKQLHENRVLAR